MNFEKFESFPEFLRANDLVELGLYPTAKALYFARQRGNSPDFLKIGRKVLYPKSSIISFISYNTWQGNITKKDIQLAKEKENE